MQNDISRLRGRINELDEQLVRLLNERAELALQIGKSKQAIGAGAYDAERERSVLEHIDTLNTGPLSKGALEEVYAAIMTACRELQIP